LVTRGETLNFAGRSRPTNMEPTTCAFFVEQNKFFYINTRRESKSWTQETPTSTEAKHNPNKNQIPVKI